MATESPVPHVLNTSLASLGLPAHLPELSLFAPTHGKEGVLVLVLNVLILLIKNLG